ncbi:hypothetical protein [Pedobacter sp. W3I1]|uniref:hypothetical protein n=1 Tax=Pedobacter sp. W3I1 TaxID=3042291 RepID=UPI0027D8B929|nr:hypothetical protein [Pedobacter sp. W3I1]
METELNSLMTNIHVDDAQLNVYSSKISDLLLRASIEIESITKEIFKNQFGTLKKNFKFDFDGLDVLNPIYFLEVKEVIVSSVNCFQTNRTILPFAKNTKNTITQKDTYGWNNAYQNLKHDRANSFTFGSLKYLFDALAALFLLNIYFKDEIQYMGKQIEATKSFKESQGSTIFSIKLDNNWGFDDYSRFARYPKANPSCTFIPIPELNSYNSKAPTMREFNNIRKRSVLERLTKLVQDDPKMFEGKSPEEADILFKKNSFHADDFKAAGEYLAKQNRLNPGSAFNVDYEAHIIRSTPPEPIPEPDLFEFLVPHQST